MVSPRILGYGRAYARPYPKMRPSSPRRAPGQADKYQRANCLLHLPALQARLIKTEQGRHEADPVPFFVTYPAISRKTMPGLSISPGEITPAKIPAMLAAKTGSLAQR
jgi:hypothetical protein